MRLVVLLCAALFACGGPIEATPPGDASAADGGTTDATDAAADADDDAAREAAAPLRVLFIGNSYTYVNDLPGRITAVASAQGDAPPIKVSSVTIAAAALVNHWNDPNVKAAIAAGGNDFVVLQGQSVEPAATPTTFHTYAALLAGAVKEASATPVFYETWARKAGSDVYLQPWSGGSPDAMQALLLAAYAKAAKDAQAKLAPVGEAFRAVRNQYPLIDLYDTDGSHPSAAGTYLAACVFYDVLTGTTLVAPGGVPSGVSGADAATLRVVAAQAVAAHP